MPIYEYECQACRQAFEELVRAPHEEPKLRCPHCGTARISRKPSVFAARSAAAPAASLPTRACGRCGDPDGPCGR